RQRPAHLHDESRRPLGPPAAGALDDLLLPRERQRAIRRHDHERHRQPDRRRLPLRPHHRRHRRRAQPDHRRRGRQRLLRRRPPPPTPTRAPRPDSATAASTREGTLPSTPARNSTGSATVSYTIANAKGSTATANVTLTVTSPNPAPPQCSAPGVTVATDAAN